MRPGDALNIFRCTCFWGHLTPTHHTHNGTKTLLKSHLGLGLFQNLTFQQETFRHGYFISGTFRYEDISAQEHFGMGIFWHHGRLGMGTLQHWNISAQCYFGTWTHAETPKCPWFWNIPMPKCCHAEISSCQKVHMMKYPCRNASCWNLRCPNKPKPGQSLNKKNDEKVNTRASYPRAKNLSWYFLWLNCHPCA